MIPQARLTLDPRTADDLAAELLQRAPGYVPEWRPGAAGADLALTRIAARFGQAILQRLNQAPDRDRIAFLDMLGVRIAAATPARAPVVFTLAATAPDAHIAAGLRLAAPPPPGSPNQVLFETETATGVGASQLTNVLAVWPGRDGYADYSGPLQAGSPFTAFRVSDLVNTPHCLYIGHMQLLALAGQAQVSVAFDLDTNGSDRLKIAWEYWDGKVWREFLNAETECGSDAGSQPDGTLGLTRSGRVLLQTDCAQTAVTAVNGVTSYWIRGRLDQPLPPDPARIPPTINSVKISAIIARPLPQPDEAGTAVKGMAPDKAFADASPVDLSKTFFPLGQNPSPGAVFYFTSQEAFTKPGAKLQIALKTAQTPQGSAAPASALAAGTGAATGSTTSPLTHEIVWEYWNGEEWALLPSSESLDFTSSGSADVRDFTEDGAITATVPADIAPTSVNDTDGLWMRVRLVSGGFGYVQTVNWTTGQAGDAVNTFSFVVNQAPAIQTIQLGYVWTNGPFLPDAVLCYNDFTYQDHSEDNRWAGNPYEPYGPLTDATPALYLGFTKALPLDDVGVYFDIQGDPAADGNPPLLWEYSDGIAWQPLAVQDGTDNGTGAGIVSFIAPADSAVLTRFDAPLFWYRARLKQDGPPPLITVRAILPHAVWAIQRQSLTNEPLGAGTGLPNQTLTFRQVPVLPGETIQVDEIQGARADVEWRLLARDVSGGDQSVVETLEALLAADGTNTDLVAGNVRLVRNRLKRVTDVWVTWQGQPDLYLSGPHDRHYVLERSSGRLVFGDGVRGAPVPAGAPVVALAYQTGGGSTGNVAAGAINQVLGAVPGLEAVRNPAPAGGGCDTESLNAYSARGPRALRSRGRAVLPEDYETLAREAAPAVAYARAIPARDPAGRDAAGWVTLLILPTSDDPRPFPSPGLCEEVRQYLQTRVCGDIAGAASVHVTGPTYYPVDITATLTPKDSSEAGAVESAAQAAVAGFLQPLTGGPGGNGWDLGRDLYLSDIARVLQNAPGVDAVVELSLSVAGQIQGNRVSVPPEQIVVAGAVRLALTAGPKKIT